MSAPSPRRSARFLAALAVLPATVVLTAGPASAVPDPGAPVPTGFAAPATEDGWSHSTRWLSFEVGTDHWLRPEHRAHLLEFMEP